MADKPTCSTCGKRIDRFQRAAPKTPGVVVPYPCLHWLSENDAAALVEAWRTS